jgi:hypothetical protein
MDLSRRVSQPHVSYVAGDDECLVIWENVNGGFQCVPESLVTLSYGVLGERYAWQIIAIINGKFWKFLCSINIYAMVAILIFLKLAPSQTPRPVDEIITMGSTTKLIVKARDQENNNKEPDRQSHGQENGISVSWDHACLAAR